MRQSEQKTRADRPENETTFFSKHNYGNVTKSYQTALNANIDERKRQAYHSHLSVT